MLTLIVGWSPTAVAVALVLLYARVFGLTAFYHRYFSHRAFKTSRVVQFLGAFLGSSAAQRGPIWWAAHHRHHHRASDKPDDIHSPRQQGFLWSHMLWFTTRENYGTDTKLVKDWLQYPELRWIDRWDVAAPALLAMGTYGLGALLESWAPHLGTNGPQMLVWGFIVSTVALYHVTFSINSLAHKFGTRRFDTKDDSRNNFWLALVTFGEGWHNNHHYFPNSARQGFRWWEIDVTYYLLLIMASAGLVWDLKPAPAHARRPSTASRKVGE
ncbi:acyl-CoA desaturase [Pseudobythopirellula maris]|uniref:acyl-CoA desaturase n=1 Tax=Pseudobythopirellula maris TaxID=2527991 RepID=UPI0018D3D5A2|nr:acyl-CoA desaturase [Pseudobythopirellula maris]